MQRADRNVSPFLFVGPYLKKGGLWQNIRIKYKKTPIKRGGYVYKKYIENEKRVQKMGVL